MKWVSIIVIIAVAIWVALPPSLTVTFAQDAQAAIVVLDVCHPAAPALSSNGDMPCMKEGSYLPLPPARAKVHAAVNSPLNPVSIVFQDERPPEA